MTERTPPRPLWFEQLEKKLSPASLLVAVAPLPESEQIEIDAWFAAGKTQRNSESGWKWRHDTQELLRFIEAQTTTCDESSGAMPPPSTAAAQAADTWFQLNDETARDAVASHGRLWITQP